MTQRMKTRNGERGVALVLALMILVLLTIMAMGALVTARRSIEISGNSRYNMTAFYAADSGMNRVIADFLSYYNLNKGAGFKVRGDVSPKSAYAKYILVDKPLYGTAVSSAVPEDPADSQFARDMVWTNTLKPTLLQWQKLVDVYTLDNIYPIDERCYGRMEDGFCKGLYYEVWYHVVGSGKSGIKILAMARQNDNEDYTDDRVDAAIEYYLVVNDYNNCDNAIFASGRAIGQSINGNVKIHGGMNVQCSQIDDPATECAGYPENCEVGSFGGSAAVNNNYHSQNPGGPDYCPDWPDYTNCNIDQMDYDDENNWTLGAKVLVRNCGIKAVTGNSTVGLAGADGPMTQIVVDGGFGDTYGALASGFVNSTVFTSDPDGVIVGIGEYDKKIPPGTADFPLVYTPIQKLPPNINLKPQLTPWGYESLGNKLNTASASNNMEGATTPPGQWCNLTATSDLAFALPPAVATVGSTCDPSPGGDRTSCLIFTRPSAGSAPMHITVKQDKVFDFSGCATPTIDGGNKDITYEGKGTFFYQLKDVTIDHKMYASNNFPSGSALAFVTGGNMTLGSGAQAQLEGLFYAQNSITIPHQTIVAGIVMTNEFNIGGQVPELWQVPGLASNAPAAFGEFCALNARLSNGGWRLIY